MHANHGSAVEAAQLRLYLRQRAALRDHEHELRRERAWQLARLAAARLRSEFGAHDVIAFGSLVGSAVFDEHSDVDLAVTGVPDHAYLDAVRMLLGLDGAYLVDLVRLEDAPAGLRQAIEAKGVPV